MTNEEIRVLLELEAAATPEPWEFNSYSAVQTRDREICCVPAEHGDQSTGVDNANGWLIPAARNATRPLAEEVLRLRGENERLRTAVLNQVGDNLCWIDGYNPAQVLPQEEFLESCRRYHAQLANTEGVYRGGMTIAQLEAENQRLREEVAEQEALFELRQKADMRAIKRWREAHPGKELVSPDQADLCVWLMGQLDALGAFPSLDAFAKRSER